MDGREDYLANLSKARLGDAKAMYNVGICYQSGIGVGIDASFMYYVYMGIVFILLPVIPSSIVALIILIITRITGVLKNKDLFMYISMFLIIA